MWRGDGGSEDAAAKHELVGHVPHAAVVGEVVDQGAQVTAILARHLPCRAVKVGQQSVAEPDLSLDGVEDGLAALAKLVDLAWSVGAVAPEHRTEKPILHPAHVEFLVLLVARCTAAPLGVVAAAEESADVGIEVGTSRHRVVESGGNLLAQHVPRRGDVAGPHVGAVVLLSGEGRPCHDKHALVACGGALPLVHTAHGAQRECVAHAPPGAHCGHVVVVAVFGIEEVGVGGVHPPGVGAVAVEALEILPVDGARIGAEGVVDLHARRIFHAGRPEGQAALGPGLDGEQQTLRVELAELLRHGAEAGPDADHEMGMLAVHGINHLLTILELFRQEVHGVPQIVAAPVLPVLDNTVEGHVQGTVLVDDALGLAGRLVALLRLPVAIGPKWEHGHLTCELAHLGDDAIG